MASGSDHLKRTAGAAAAIIAALAFTFVAGPFAQADEYFPICDADAGLLTHDFSSARLDDISHATEVFETSPFPNSCQTPGVFEGRPKTGLFRREVPRQDPKGRSSADFLNRVGRRVLSAMDFEDAKLAYLENCLRRKTSTDECKLANDWMTETLQPMVRTARMNLALAQTRGEFKTLVMKSAKLSVNSDLNQLGTQKETAWDPLTPNELEKARRIIAEYVAETAKAAQALRRDRIEKFTNDTLLASRYTNGMNYVQTLRRNPILQYLKSPVPPNDEVAAAIGKMRANLRSDRAYAAAAIKATTQTHHQARTARSGIKVQAVRASLDPDALGLLDFSSFVEEELRESPADCGLAAALHYTKENRALGNGLAIGVPLVVASLALPFAGQAMAGAVLGFATGTGYAVQSKFDRDTAAERFISKLEVSSGDDHDNGYDKLDQADHEMKLSIALGPVLGLGGPLFTKTAVVGLRATRLGARLAMKSTAKSR